MIFNQPNFNTMTAAQYKAAIDASIAALALSAQQFAPGAQSTPNMTVRVSAGSLWSGVSIITKAAQNTGTITAPTTNPRIDRVYLSSTGFAYVRAGAESATPTPPVLQLGETPICQVLLQTSSTSITDSMITDERLRGSRKPQQLFFNVLAGDNVVGSTTETEMYSVTASLAAKQMFLYDGVVAKAYGYILNNAGLGNQNITLRVKGGTNNVTLITHTASIPASANPQPFEFEYEVTWGGTIAMSAKSRLRIGSPAVPGTGVAIAIDQIGNTSTYGGNDYVTVADMDVNGWKSCLTAQLGLNSSFFLMHIAHSDVRLKIGTA